MNGWLKTPIWPTFWPMGWPATLKPDLRWSNHPQVAKLMRVVKTIPKGLRDGMSTPV